SRWNTKSTSIARLTPVTTLAEAFARSRLSTAKRHDPLERSTKTTAGPDPTAAATRSSRLPRSQPVFDTASSAPVTPLICSAASTRAPASRPWQTTTPRSRSLIVFLQVLPHPTLLLHLLDQPSIERGGDVHARVAEQMHHRDHFGNHGDVLAGI